jgi:hypothetical protein
MPLSFRRLLAAGVIAAAAIGVTACGSSSSSTSSPSSTSAASSTTTSSTTTTASTTTASAPATVVGKSTAIAVNPAVSAALKHAGITVTADAPATAKTTLLVFPARGGKIVVTTLSGTIDHTGGLTFRHSGKSVTLTNPVINTETKQLTAVVNGQPVPIFDLNLASLKRVSGPHGSVVASDIKLTVTHEAASALNTGLGVSTFKGGMTFGIATLAIAVNY